MVSYRFLIIISLSYSNYMFIHTRFSLNCVVFYYLIMNFYSIDYGHYNEWFCRGFWSCSLYPIQSTSSFIFDGTKIIRLKWNLGVDVIFKQPLHLGYFKVCEIHVKNYKNSWWKHGINLIIYLCHSKDFCCQNH